MESRARVIFSEGDGSRWEVATRAPAAPLRPYLPQYVGYREVTACPSLRREVSGSRVVVIFDLGPPILVSDAAGARSRHPGGFLAGLSNRYSEVAHDGVQEGIQLDLSTVGARLLFGVPLDTITNQVVSLDLVLRDERELTARLREQAGWDARFDLLDRWLTRRLGEPTAGGRIAAWAVDHIERAGGAVDVASLALDLGYSEKQVGRIFREHVGVGPKRFARIVRFDALVRAARARPEARWVDLAARYGFYDQAHLAREVKDLCGLTPTDLRADLEEIGLVFQ